MYKSEELIALAKRENNSKRSFLLVNRLQGKHIPVSPTRSLELFSALAEKIRPPLPGKPHFPGEKDFPFISPQESLPSLPQNNGAESRLLVIGFAETATAIGAHIAIALGARYIQTTRESYENCRYLCFSEEHSHASEQKLIRDPLDDAIEQISDILFVEDEITTGKTIRNIVTLLRRTYGKRLRFHAASLINGMEADSLRLFEEEEIRCYFLLRTDHSTCDLAAERIPADGGVLSLYPRERETGCSSRTEETSLCFSEIPGGVNTRRLCRAKDYERACLDLIRRLAETFDKELHTASQRILVLGTEECMYPAIFVGSHLESLGHQVWTHSTTRSPICVSSDEGYPLQTRAEICSPYESSRKTFLYNLASYDSIYVITDAEHRGTLVPALLACGNRKINWIRWCNDENIL